MVVSPADIATDGVLAWALEGVFVEVRDVEVTEVEPEPGPGDGRDGAPTNEFRVADSLRINDFIYLLEALPAVGDRFAAIRGSLRYGNGNSKIEIRAADDLVRE
jgi:hypothetical protein